MRSNAPRPVPRPLLAIAALLLSGCAAASAAQSSPGDSPANGLVITGRALDTGGALLDALIGRVGNMEVRRTPRCPELRLRGSHTILGPSNPAVYVDGTHTVDTCVLEMLPAREVDRVEVYPSGVTGQPGIHNHPFGVILVFMRTS